MKSVPFLPEFRERLLSGRKWATTRTKRIGNVGDQFTAFLMTFKLTKVQDLALYEVAAEHYDAEGFDDSQGFIDIWNKIHPKARYKEYQRVYYHEFKLMARGIGASRPSGHRPAPCPQWRQP